MKTRTIPSDVFPWWECTVNHKKYRYPAGATVSVPDAVADLIDNIAAAQRQPDAPYIPNLPPITASAEGKVLKVVGGRWVLAEDEIADRLAPLETTATLSEDEQTGKQIITCDKTAKNFYDAARQGRLLMLVANNVAVDESTADMLVIAPVEVITITQGGQTEYFIKVRADASSTDNLFYAAALAADDPVVLTEV